MLGVRRWISNEIKCTNLWVIKLTTNKRPENREWDKQRERERKREREKGRKGNREREWQNGLDSESDNEREAQAEKEIQRVTSYFSFTHFFLSPCLQIEI